jgi:hypothetical protein
MKWEKGVIKIKLKIRREKLLFRKSSATCNFFHLLLLRHRFLLYIVFIVYFRIKQVDRKINILRAIWNCFNMLWADERKTFHLSFLWIDVSVPTCFNHFNSCAIAMDEEAVKKKKLLSVNSTVILLCFILFYRNQSMDSQWRNST